MLDHHIAQCVGMMLTSSCLCGTGCLGQHPCWAHYLVGQLLTSWPGHCVAKLLTALALTCGVHQAAQDAQSPPEEASGDMEALQADLAHHEQRLKQADERSEVASARAAEAEAAARAAQAQAQHAQQENQRLVQSLRMAASPVSGTHL